MFELTTARIDPQVLGARLARPDAGAVVVFEGRVRDNHRGRPVTRLEYEAYDDMALPEGAAILEETERLYPGAKVLCVHRTGVLDVGEIAVWIGVSSSHRHTGFAACRQVIEEIKRRLPVWKKEHHPDGAAEWVNCTTEAAGDSNDDAYHARQKGLTEVGATGQARLSRARVLVVGLGGLGCPAALYLAGAGIGHLTLVDGGLVELSNLHRQILFTADEIGAPKAEAAATRLRRHNPQIEVTAHQAEFGHHNARALVTGRDIVLDCTDNFATRFLIHDVCLALGVPLVSAAVHRFEGTLDVFRKNTGGCLHCQWPGRTPAELDVAGNCDGAPVFGPTVGALGIMQAAEVVKLLLHLDENAGRHTLLLNLLDGSCHSVERARQAGCPVCSQFSQRSPAPPSVQIENSDFFVSPEQVEAMETGTRLVYLAAPDERKPAGKFTVAADDIATIRTMARESRVLLRCRYGLRSAALARLLRSEGFVRVHAVRAGA